MAPLAFTQTCVNDCSRTQCANFRANCVQCLRDRTNFNACQTCDGLSACLDNCTTQCSNSLNGASTTFKALLGGKEALNDLVGIHESTGTHGTDAYGKNTLDHEKRPATFVATSEAQQNHQEFQFISNLENGRLIDRELKSSLRTIGLANTAGSFLGSPCIPAIGCGASTNLVCCDCGGATKCVTLQICTGLCKQ